MAMIVVVLIFLLFLTITNPDWQTEIVDSLETIKEAYLALINIVAKQITW